MNRAQGNRLSRLLEGFAVQVTEWVGCSWGFLAAILLTIFWLVSGPFFGFSDTWQLLMNTVSSVVTFLMVFLLQRSQNKEAMVMQVKLNEILAALKGASNQLIDVEDLSEAEIRALHHRYQQLAERVRHDGADPGSACSIEQTEAAPEEVGGESRHAGKPRK